MKRVITTMLLFAVYCFSALQMLSACDGEKTKLPYPDDEFHGYTAQLNAGFQKPTVAQLEAKKLEAEKGEPQAQLDYALAVWQSGELKQATTLLERLAEQNSEDYAIVSRVGLIYELQGENVKALEWAHKAHFASSTLDQASDWLHIQILEAKIKHKDDPSWFYGNRIVSFSTDGQTPSLTTQSEVTDFLGTKQQLASVQKALEDQLHDRLGFTKTVDPVIANLLVTLGDIQMVTQQQDNANQVYRLAMNYAGGSENVLSMAQMREAPKAERLAIDFTPPTIIAQAEDIRPSLAGMAFMSPPYTTFSVIMISLSALFMMYKIKNRNAVRQITSTEYLDSI